MLADTPRVWSWGWAFSSNVVCEVRGSDRVYDYHDQTNNNYSALMKADSDKLFNINPLQTGALNICRSWLKDQSNCKVFSFIMTRLLVYRVCFCRTLTPPCTCHFINELKPKSKRIMFRHLCHRLSRITDVKAFKHYLYSSVCWLQSVFPFTHIHMQTLHLHDHYIISLSASLPTVVVLDCHKHSLIFMQ